jgi:ATP-dependent helicase/nuclease subunit A
MKTTIQRTSDEGARRRIGPWQQSGQPELSDFAPCANFVVHAAAGSGKTTALVARIVALVREGVPLGDLAAITFTRKAAGEMNERLYRELRRARRELGGREQALVQEALDALPRCFIGTIHSFCARILRNYPLAAGLPSRFQAGVDDRDERELRQEALSSYLQEAHRERPDELAALTEMGVEPDDLSPFFARLCRFPDLEPHTDAPPEPPDLDAAVEEATALLEKWQPRRPDPLPNGRDSVMKAFDRAEKLLEHDQVETPPEKAAFLEEFAGAVKSSGEARVTLKNWGERGSSEYERAYDLRDDELPHLAEHTIAPKLRQWSAFVHERVTAFLTPAVARYRHLRKERGLLTHADLLLLTRDLLRDNPDVRRRVQERYPRVLVDEFQDTDPLQAEILFYLAGDDPNETNWRDCTPRAGSLFIVGDDKQSIYRFRRADKSVFDEVGSLVAESDHGEIVDLTRNFRSLGALCDWCNDTFARLFDEPELRDVQAEYVPFEADRPDGDDACGLRRIDIEKIKYNPGDDIAAQDAARIADFIRAACDGGRPDLIGGESAVFENTATPSDFLILTRRKKRLSVYTDALAARGLPFDVTGSEDLGDSQELRALVGLLRCALRPDDPVAAVRYLRGGACGFSDADLYDLKQAGGRFDQLTTAPGESVLGGLRDDLADRFETAFARIRRARERLTTTRPTLALGQIAREAGLVAGALHPATPADASLRGGQMLRALSHARNLAEQGMDWGEITKELERVVRGDEDLDGMTLETGRGEAVRVMNVHQAKGLEAPVVFLADPYSSGGGGHEPDLHVRRAEDDVVLPVVEGEDYRQRVTHAPLGWHDAFQAEEARRQDAEDDRLLYVGATRAENLLVVSTYAPKDDGGPWGRLHPALDRADVPQLAAHEAKRNEPSPAPAPGLDTLAGKRQSRVEALSAPSYRVTTVTESESGAPASLAEGEGYGQAFGAAVHALFELLVREHASSLSGVPVRAVLKRHLDDPTGDEVSRARMMGERLLTSNLWADVLAARRVHAEYPVALSARDDGGGDAPLTVEHGTINLLYQTTNDDWSVVDFKTDRVNGDVRLAANHPYRRQVRRYAEAWERATGERPARLGLWLADAGELCAVNVN